MTSEEIIKKQQLRENPPKHSKRTDYAKWESVMRKIQNVNDKQEKESKKFKSKENNKNNKKAHTED